KAKDDMHIISQETIKPSSLTPSHLKTHVLTLVDNYTPAIPVPFVFFYKNYNDGDINILKKFLSPSMSHIDCNYEGVEFLEASHDSWLEDFILNDESLHELVPNVGENFSNLAGVQLNHFKGGGVAVGISISHKAADGFAIATFINQWGKVTRGESPFKPNFITSSISHINNVKPPKVVSNCPRAHIKLSYELHGHKCNKPSSYPSRVNMRNKVIKNNPEKAVGNIVVGAGERVIDLREIALNEIVAKLRKMKIGTEGIRDVQEIGENIAKLFGGDHGGLELFWTSSFCWFPLYEVDFGWGMPVRVKYLMPKVDNKNLVLMDTPQCV
ncbi:hypothetical protein M8C21_024654, partial [Ambrosia artemisiifolia]